MLTPRLLSSVEFEIIAVERNRPGNWWRFQNVSNPYSRLYLVTKGEAHVRHHGRRFRLGRDSLHVIPAFTRTDLYCEDYFEVQYVHFTSRLSGGPDLFSILDCQYQADATPREHELFTRLLKLNPDAGLRDYDPHKTVAETQAKRDSRLTGGPDVARYLETDGLVRQLLAPILRTATDRSVSRLAGIGRFEETLAYMNEHLDEPLTLDSLAARAHLNPTYFSDLFSETLGLRPIDYLNRRRVERAQMMLLTTSLTVKQIAARVGFTGSAYFCRVFKKYCGHTPTAYRETGGAAI